METGHSIILIFYHHHETGFAGFEEKNQRNSVTKYQYFFSRN